MKPSVIHVLCNHYLILLWAGITIKHLIYMYGTSFISSDTPPPYQAAFNMLIIQGQPDDQGK